MTSLVSLLKFIASLPEEKPEGLLHIFFDIISFFSKFPLSEMFLCSPEGYIRKRRADTSDVVFDVNSHSEKELHQFKLSVMELILRVLGNDNFVIKVCDYHYA